MIVFGLRGEFGMPSESIRTLSLHGALRVAPPLCMYLFLYLCMSLSIYIYIYIYVSVSMDVSVPMYISVCLCLYVCLNKYLCMSGSIYISDTVPGRPTNEGAAAAYRKIVELEAKLRLQPGMSRILGASRVWDQDWGRPRVKCGTVGCNPTSLTAVGDICYIVK